MEAATPLRQPRVHVLMGRVIVENVVVDDPATAAFLDRADGGGRGRRRSVVTDAIEIGARVLEREQAAVDAEFVRSEFEKVSREVETAFTDKARVVAEFFGTKVDEVFGAEDGHLAKELQRLFGEGSTAAVQHQLRQIMLEQSAQDARGPAAPVLLRRRLQPAGRLQGRAPARGARRRRAARRRSWRRCASRWSRSSSSCSGCSSEREKALEVAAEHARGTAKGRPYEEAVAEAVDAIARGHGRRLRRGRRLPRRRRAQGRRGGRHRRLLGLRPRPDRVRGQELAHARARRRSPSSRRRWPSARPTTASGSCRPRTGCRRAPPALREVGGDKLFVVFDPEDGSRLALEVAYSLARARVLMAKGGVEGLDAPALRAEVERALGAMEDVRRIKLHLTNAAGGIE